MPGSSLGRSYGGALLTFKKHCRDILQAHLCPPKHVFEDLLARIYPDAAQALVMLLEDCKEMRKRIPANAKGARGDGSGRSLCCGAPEPALGEGIALETQLDDGSITTAPGQGITLGATPSTKLTFNALGRQFLAKYLEMIECPETPV